jgi:ankyrin repeat protein
MNLLKSIGLRRHAADMIVGIELHSVEQIEQALDAGIDARAPIRGKSPINRLTEMCSRSDDFPRCLRLLLDRGGVLYDPVLAPVLLNDTEALAAAVRAAPSLLEHRTNMTSAFTPLVGATLLHVAAEYGNADAARLLIERGADVNAEASVDEYGLNGHTPISHTVNSSHNRAAPILQMLLDAGAKSDIALRGITWGKGFEWETTLFDVTSIPYAQFGLLPQVHRAEVDIYDNVTSLVAAAGHGAIHHGGHNAILNDAAGRVAFGR